METSCAALKVTGSGGGPAWLRRTRQGIEAILRRGLTPEKAALALAVGFACAFFPILGAATPLCIVAGLLLRLNQGLIQLVNGLTFALYAPLVLLFVRLGDLVLGNTRATVDLASMPSLLRGDPAQLARQLGAFALHALIGWALLAPVLGWLVYALALPVTRAMARKAVAP